MIQSLRAFDLDIISPRQCCLHSKSPYSKVMKLYLFFSHSLFYHSAILLLFQPFVNLELVTSAVLPREVCYQAADAITGIVKSYSDLYTLRRTPSFVPYFVLISAIIHLFAVKTQASNKDARGKLSQGISDLQEMTQCHGFAFRAIDALRHLAHIWGVDIFPNGTNSRDLPDLPGPSPVLPDQFSPDISILETLQSIQPIISPKHHSLFSPFPMQGLPLVVLDTQREKDGFVLASQ
jgi:hypothetical protein